MCLDVLLQILWALEGFTTELAFVRFERDVDANVGCNVVTLDGRGAASAPLALQAQVVCALAPDMALTDVVLKAKSARTQSVRPDVIQVRPNIHKVFLEMYSAHDTQPIDKSKDLRLPNSKG